MADSAIDIEVAFAVPEKQLCVSIKVIEKTCVQQAIHDSEIIKHFPEIDLTNMQVGIFGKTCTLDKLVEQNDRIEIYRPLIHDPMDARRKRAANR